MIFNYTQLRFDAFIPRSPLSAIIKIFSELNLINDFYLLLRYLIVKILIHKKRDIIVTNINFVFLETC